MPRTTRSLLLVLLGAACASPGGPPSGSWQSPRGRDHELVGRVWDVSGAQFAAPAVLVERLAPARFVLLGEQHDNADHHRLQAWVLRALVGAGRRPAVAFEMLSLDQAPLLARHLDAAPRDAAGLGDAVGWSRSGWPPWRLYAPIAEAALGAGLPIVAAGLSRAATGTVRQDGLTALGAPLVARLGLDRPLATDERDAMAAEIAEAHCGYASPGVVERMIDVQRARDAHMADRLHAAAGPGGAVLIAGVAHVRRDRGVPAFLARLDPGASITSVAFLEVRSGQTTPEAYGRGGALAFDYVWFTPRVDDIDPCAKFQKSLERLRRTDR